MIFQRKLSLFSAALTSLFISFTATTAQADTWTHAPLACLPDRAVPWSKVSEKEPCHCPPQSFCTEEPDIKPNDIVFIVETGLDANGRPSRWQTKSGSIVGSHIPELVNGKVTLKQVFEAHSDLDRADYRKKNIIRDILHQPVIDQLGIDIKKGATWSTKITIQLRQTHKLKKWLDELKMPLALAAQCCGNPCPEGLHPIIQDKRVVKPRNPENFFQITQEQAAAYKQDIVNINHTAKEVAEEIAAKKNEEGRRKAEEKDMTTNDRVATMPISTTVTDYEIHQPDYKLYNQLKSKTHVLHNHISEYAKDYKNINTLRTLINHLTVYHQLVKSAPEAVKLRATIEIAHIKALLDSLHDERDMRNKPLEFITVQTLQCKAQKSFLREGCLRKGTQIVMEDGSSKSVEDVNIGDFVMGNHGPVKVLAKSRFTQDVDHMYSINGGVAFFTVEHPILTPEGWKSIDPSITSTKNSNTVIIGQLLIGDTIITKDGKNVTVTSITEEAVDGGADAYNLSVEGDGSFIANDFVMKGFKQMQMHY